MNNETVDQQTKKLFSHMKDYGQAEQVSKKAESAIFDKHRLADGGYGPGLRDELQTCRQNFANEWGATGWRNQEFIKKQAEDIRKLLEEEKQTSQTQPQADKEGRDKFIASLNSNKQNQSKPKMR